MAVTVETLRTWVRERRKVTASPGLWYGHITKIYTERGMLFADVQMDWAKDKRATLRIITCRAQDLALVD